MSQLGCPCGNTVKDNVVPCPTEGRLLRDEDGEGFELAMCREIVALFDARDSGRRDEWVRTALGEQYPVEVDDAGVVSDLMSKHILALDLAVSECSSCGRLFVQRENFEGELVVYSPDEPGYKRLLAARNRASS